MFLFKILILSISLLFSTASYSAHENAIFYPMPIHVDGQYITAQQLFLRDDGAIWMYDIYGQLHLFDGRNIFTLGEKSDDELPKKVTYFDGHFWFVKNNTIQYWSNSTNIVNDYFLKKGMNLQVLDSNEDFIWGSDNEHFFVYSPKLKSLAISSINEANTSAILDQITITGGIYLDNRWLVSTSEGIFEFDMATESYIPFYLGQYIDSIFYSEKTDSIILGTHNSVWVAELGNNDLKIKAKIPLGSSLLSFAETSENLWFGSDNGLFQWNIETQNTYHFRSILRDDYSIEGNKIYSLLPDQGNGLWIATDNGVSYYSNSSQLFTRIRYREANGRLDIHEVKAILQTEDERAWLGSPNGLFSIDTSNHNKNLSKITGHAVNALSYNNGDIWAATKHGIYSINVKTQEVKMPLALQIFSEDNIEKIFAASDNVVWFSSATGLYKYDIKKKQLHSLGFSWALQHKYSTKVTHIYGNSHGQVFIGTNMGLYSYENGSLTFDYAYSRAGGILDMVDTEYGNSWIVSNYGLQLTETNGKRTDIELPSEYVTPHCVLSSSNGVWLSSSKGLSLYTHYGRLVKHFGSQQGLINNELLPDLCSISPNGKMLFASKDGVFFINEQDLLEYRINKPNVVLGQIKIDDTIASYGEEDHLKTPIPYGASISFLFGVLPEFQNKSLSFQLLGSSDEEWQDFDGSLLIFDSLKPGKYILRIKPRNTGQRSSNVTEFLFYVEVPWFLAPWFITLLVSVSIGFVIIIYSWRSKEIKKANEELKKRVEIKTQQLSNQSKVLLSSNRQLQKLLAVRQHVISEMAEQAQQPIKDIQLNLQKKGSLTNLALANQCEHSLLLLDQLTRVQPFIDIQKNQRTNQVLAPLLNAAIKSWKDEFDVKGVDLLLEDKSQGCSLFVQPILIDAIFNNIIFNLLKRSDFGQQVNVFIQSDQDKVKIYFHSQGRQISAQELEDLRCVDLSQTIEVINEVLGLLSVKLLTIQNGGTFDVLKNNDGSNELVLTWPVAQDVIRYKAELVKEQALDEEFDNHQKWLMDVYSLVENNYKDPAFGTSSAAKHLFISERNLQRKFKQLAHRSFMEFVIDMRLESACELLISGSKVSNAAFDSGFNDASYFSKRFKRHYGLSPTQFITENE